ncbi:MAG: IS5/IS1182 family transposase, partial [Deltaproteobacteria bacterium]
SDSIRTELRANGINPVIPPRKNRKKPIEYDSEIYKLREKVERFFSKIKQFRRIATRYEKLSKTFLAFIHLAASLIIARKFVNTA